MKKKRAASKCPEICRNGHRILWKRCCVERRVLEGRRLKPELENNLKNELEVKKNDDRSKDVCDGRGRHRSAC